MATWFKSINWDQESIGAKSSTIKMSHSNPFEYNRLIEVELIEIHVELIEDKIMIDKLMIILI